MPHSNNLRIIVIDDDEDDYYIIASLLEEISEYKITPTWCNNYQQALDMLQTQKFNLAFVDYRLGIKTGIELIEKAIEHGVTIPIIILTGKGNTEIDKQAVRKGAYDYLIKGEINAEVLERSIRYALARHDSKKALQQSEKKFRSIYEHSKDAMFILNEELGITDVNDATLQLLNTTREALIGTFSLDMVLHPDKNVIIERLATNNEIDEEEVQVKFNESPEYHGLLTITKERDSEDKTYLQGVFHDITHLKEAEQSKLQTEKFEANQRFVRMLAHEVRNPLNNIMLALESAQMEGPDTQQLYYDIVKRNSIRINDLITQLLHSFKISDVALQEISLSEIVEQALIAIEDRLTLKRIQLKKQLLSEHTLNGDAEKLKLAILNFFVNAIEAMEEDKGMLTITSFQKENHLYLVIEDNGCGMNDEQVQHLFEPYFTTKKNGIGLGLSSSLGILRSHQASVNVNSHPNKGTQFIIGFKKG